MSIKRNLILVRLKENVRALQPLVNENVERKVPLTDAIAKARELLESCLSIDRSDYSVKFSKPTREAHRLSGLVDSKDLELQTMFG